MLRTTLHTVNTDEEEIKTKESIMPDNYSCNRYTDKMKEKETQRKIIRDRVCVRIRERRVCMCVLE